MRKKSYIANMRAKRAENFDLLTFAPPPPPPSEKRIDAPAYGMALYTRYYTDKTLKLREIYEYASELSERTFLLLTFSQSKTVISFIILLVLQILSLSLKLNICIHKNNQCTFLVIYHLWYDASSVASFLVLRGGGQDPEMYRQKIYVLILRERAKRTSA